MLGYFCAEVITLKPFSIHKMFLSSYEEDVRQILSRSTNQNNFQGHFCSYSIET